MVEFYGETGVVMFRKNLHAYAKGHNGASAFRNVVNALVDPRLMRESIEEFFATSALEWGSAELVHFNKRSV